MIRLTSNNLEKYIKDFPLYNLLNSFNFQELRKQKEESKYYLPNYIDCDSSWLSFAIYYVLWRNLNNPLDDLLANEPFKEDFARFSSYFGGETLINFKEPYEITLGNLMIYPSHKKNNMTINQEKGCHLQDRFDITLKCIKNFYTKEEKIDEQTKTMQKIINENDQYFSKFGKGIRGFKNYTKFYFLDVFFNTDGTIINLNPKENHKKILDCIKLRTKKMVFTLNTLLNPEQNI